MTFLARRTNFLIEFEVSLTNLSEFETQV